MIIVDNERLLKKRVTKLEKILKDKSICAVKRDDSGRFTIKYDDGQVFRCSGELPNRSINYFFSRELVKKKRIF